MYYDALGRVVKTVNADNSEQRVVYGVPTTLTTPDNFTPTPWENYAYDANDLAPITNPTDTTVPSTHWYTPKNSVVDALGRTIETNEFFNNSNYANTIRMQYVYDIRGNLLFVFDPYGRTVFEHVYDLRAPQKDTPLPPLKTIHIDKGLSTLLFDALEKPLEGFDAKGAHSLSAYDTLQRPAYSWACNKTGDAITLRGFTVYGEGATTPATFNLNGKPYEIYDEAGKLTSPSYDFKGNLLTKTRKVVADSVLKSALSSYTNYIMNWDTPPTLSSMTFETNMEYDALNRITRLVLPEDLSSAIYRKEIIPTYNTAGSLEKVELYDPSITSTTTYVENIAYNAKGQRLLIAFGNNRMTRYVYDTITFRLLRQRTEGYTKSVVGSTITYTYAAGTNKQDDGFNFDLVGNIVNIFTRVTDCGIGGTPDELDRTFEYDPIYRLTYADGRESDTQSGNMYLYDEAPIPSTPLPSNVNYYERNYVYDKLGNIESVVQSGTNGFTRDYTYNTGKNTLQKIENSTPTTIESYTYDNCGNTLTTNLNRYYVWNHADQLLCYYNDAGGGPTVFAQYDYAGQDRVSKIVRTGSTYERTVYIDGIFEYVWLDDGTLYEKNYIHIMDDKSRIAEIRIGDTFPTDISDDVVFILEDQIGSSVVRLNTSGTIIDEEEYYPFGDSSLRTFTYKRYRYVGRERDAESGLYFYGARYYCAWNCRFLSVDPLASKFAQLSPFNYSENNPINDKDIDGMQKGDSKRSEGGKAANKAGGAAADKVGAAKNTGAGTNATNANKLSGFTPSSGAPYKSGDLKAAGTDGGGGATSTQNLQGKPNFNWAAEQKPQLEFTKASYQTEEEKKEQIKYNEEVKWSTPRAVAANLLDMVNPIGDAMDIHSYSQNETDRKGRPMSGEQAVFKGIGIVAMFTPMKFASTSTSGRVFWVGTGSQTYAKEFALNNGLKTLDMTWYGKVGVFVEPIIKPISSDLNRKMWDGLSYVFARTANEPIYTVFGTYAETGVHMSSISSKSTWFRIEYPTLTNYGKTWTPLLTPN